MTLLIESRAHSGYENYKKKKTMLFNTLCKLSELMNKSTPSNTTKALYDCKLFDMRECGTREQYTPYSNNYRPVEILPFPNIAIETKVYSIGTINNQLVEVCICITQYKENEYSIQMLSRYINPIDNQIEISLQHTAGFYYNEEKERFTLGSKSFYCLHTNENLETKYAATEHSIDDESNEASWFSTIFKLLLDNINTINNQDRFIVEMTPTKMRKNNKKIPRSNDRPVYTTLRISDIQKRYGLTGRGTGNKLEEGYPRRAYVKTLRHERFVHTRGKKIKIPATWVGPERTQVGNKIYRVILDK